MNWPIFDLCITGLNVVISIINLWVLSRLRYNRKQLERYSKQWRSNVNFSAVKAIIDEANKTESRERQAPKPASDLFTRPEGFSNGKSGMSDLPPRSIL